jgi:putative heme-binding domain-containing protein
MPPNVVAELDPQEIRNLVGYLASRGAKPDYGEIRQLEIPDRRSEQLERRLIRLEDMQLAESVLRGKGSCLKCHSLYHVPEGKTFAPGLFGAGLKDATGIRESLLDPPKEIDPKYKSVKVLMENGQMVSGLLVSQSDEYLVLCTRDDLNQLILRDIPLTDIEQEEGQPQIHESNTSLMPTGFDKTLTDEEIKALINLIRQLN